MLWKVFEDLVNPKDGIIPNTALYRRMGLEEVNIPRNFAENSWKFQVADTTFADSLFRVLEKYGSRDELDVRAFLLGLGVIFKGTVEERMNCEWKFR